MLENMNFLQWDKKRVQSSFHFAYLRECIQIHRSPALLSFHGYMLILRSESVAPGMLGVSILETKGDSEEGQRWGELSQCLSINSFSLTGWEQWFLPLCMLGLHNPSIQGTVYVLRELVHSSHHPHSIPSWLGFLPGPPLQLNASGHNSTNKHRKPLKGERRMGWDIGNRAGTWQRVPGLSMDTCIFPQSLHTPPNPNHQQP